MMLLSRISFSFGRRHGDVAPIMSFDAVIPHLGTSSPHLAWGPGETNGVPFGRWQRGDA